MAKRKRFSDELRAAVEGGGLSRYAISKRIGVSEAALSRFVAGGGLAFGTLDKVAALLDLHIVTGKAKAKAR